MLKRILIITAVIIGLSVLITTGLVYPNIRDAYYYSLLHKSDNYQLSQKYYDNHYCLVSDFTIQYQKELPIHELRKELLSYDAHIRQDTIDSFINSNLKKKRIYFIPFYQFHYRMIDSQEATWFMEQASESEMVTYYHNNILTKGKMGSVQRFSGVGRSSDSKEILFYIEGRSGHLSGSGGLVLLRKTNNGWHIVRLHSWIS